MIEHLHFYPDDQKILSFRPNIVFSGTLNVNSQWTSAAHRHNFCEIMYIAGGEGSIRIDGEHYNVKTGDIVVYNSGTFHEEQCLSEGFVILFFAVDNLRISGLDEGCIIPKNACPVIDAGSYDDVLKPFISVMVHELTNKKAHYKAISTSIATMFCYYIFRLYDIKFENSNYTDICNKAKKYIEENYKSDISLDTIASSVHISKSHFVHIFRETVGLSPMKYLLHKRLTKAKQLLGHTDMPIRTIALKVGYENALTFSRVFKNSENISPTNYRNSLRYFSKT